MDNSKSENEVIREAWRRGLDVLQPTKAQLERGLDLHGRFITCDAFCFMPSVFSDEWVSYWNDLIEGNVGAREHAWRTSIRKETIGATDEKAAEAFMEAYGAAGLNCVVQTVAEGKCREEDVKRMALSRQNCRVFRGILNQVGSVDEIHETMESGRTAVIWSVNGPPLTGKLVDLDEEMSWITTWYDLGVRLMHLTYNRRNFVADGCAERTDAGLSELGVDLIKELNRVGIIVDTPHTGRQATLDAAKFSEKPIMASHTAAQGVFEHIRCKSDEELKAIAGTDGLIGVYAVPTMLGPNATLNTLLDHVEYIAKLVGPEHVCVGTDIPYCHTWPEGLKVHGKSRYSPSWWGNWNSKNQTVPSSDEASQGSLAWTNWPLYTVGLVARGFSDEDIENILAGNFMRVLKANANENELSISPMPSSPIPKG